MRWARLWTARRWCVEVYNATENSPTNEVSKMEKSFLHAIIFNREEITVTPDKCRYCRCSAISPGCEIIQSIQDAAPKRLWSTLHTKYSKSSQPLPRWILYVRIATCISKQKWGRPNSAYKRLNTILVQAAYSASWRPSSDWLV
jgi:hypothetical protein